MIEEAYCSFEVAKLLKEKGFDWPCRAFYSYDKVFDNEVYNRDVDWNTESPNGDISAPSHQMAIAWLRKEHHKIIVIRYDKVCYAGEPLSKWHLQWWWELLNEKGEFCENNMNTGNSSPEEAVEEALKYTLKHL